MIAFELIKELRGAGVTVHVEGGILDIAPADHLTDEIIAALKRHKPEILALLKNEEKQLSKNIGRFELTQDQPEWKPDKCDRCTHLSRFTGGNACRTDNGLPWLFGLLYNVPDDGGETCTNWRSQSTH